MTAPPVLVHSLSAEQTHQLHALYQGEWWSRGRTLADVQAMLQRGSLVFALYDASSGDLLAFARVLTDHIFKALIFDVIVHPAHRARGLGRTIIRHILEHPELRTVRHLELYCAPERVEYYQEFGFSAEINQAVTLMRKTNEAIPESRP